MQKLYRNTSHVYVFVDYLENSTQIDDVASVYPQHIFVFENNQICSRGFTVKWWEDFSFLEAAKM